MPAKKTFNLVANNMSVVSTIPIEFMPYHYKNINDNS